jgi:hypothetical protein
MKMAILPLTTCSITVLIMMVSLFRRGSILTTHFKFVLAIWGHTPQFGTMAMTFDILSR